MADVKRRGKYQPLIDYYYKSVAILKSRLPYVPCLWLSEGESYYGSAYRRSGEKVVHSISLSTKRCWPIDHEELIDTIAHELSHTIYYEHGPEHDAITNWFKTILLDNWHKEKDTLQGA